MSININEVRVLLKEMVDFRELSETKWIVLKKEGKKTWALVFGWQDGFDPAKNPTPFQYENYRICGKLAYNDSAMKEYDMDWLMPSVPDTEDIWDTECSIEGEGDIANCCSFWEKEWSAIEEAYQI